VSPNAIPPVALVLEARVRRDPGVVVPIPTLPFASTLKSVAPVDDARTKRSFVVVPTTESIATGVDEPTDTLPLTPTSKSETPVLEATMNGSSDPVPCTRKLVVADVALTPATVPLSIDTPILCVVGEVHRARNPVVPPVIPRPSVDVATHLVDVPDV
jgi:hypothetical protein